MRSSPLVALLSLSLAACGADQNTDPGDASDARDAAPVDAIDGGGLDGDLDADTDDVSVFDAGDTIITLGVSDGGTPDSAPPSGATPAPPAGSPDPCAAGAQPPRGDQIRTIMSAGGLRWFYVHVPPGYSGSATQLVLNFHGFTSDPFQEALLSGMNAAADTRNFIVAYPSGIAASWNAGLCCGDSAWVSHVDDVQFVRDTIDAISREYCIDSHRVFSTGMSNGGFLSHRLACELSDRIAAVAPVAGVLGVADCNPPRPVPVMHFHGTMDPLVPYYGGSPFGFPSVPVTFGAWQLREACSGAMATTFMMGDSRCEARPGCNGGSEVILCTVENGGHTWPGGSPSRRSVTLRPT
jgi:polyhydroxybutyrate depolymerase